LLVHHPLQGLKKSFQAFPVPLKGGCGENYEEGSNLINSKSMPTYIKFY